MHDPSVANECRSVIDGPIVWDKGRTQQSRCDSPYSPKGEFL